MSETMSRPPSSRSLRRASSPPALLYLKTPPPESPLRRTTSSPSICFQYTSLCDLLRSPSSTPTPPPKEPGAGSALADPERREPIKVSSPALSRDCNWGCGLWSRSTQTEPVAESSTQTDRDTTDAELLQGGQAGHTFRRFLGVQWDGSFLMLLGVLAVVIFTVAVIATLSGTTRANKKFDSLDLMPDAFEGDPSSAQQDVEVTAPSTSREAVTVLRSSDAGKRHSIKVHKAVSKVPKQVPNVRKAVSKVSKVPKRPKASKVPKAVSKVRKALSKVSEVPKVPKATTAPSRRLKTKTRKRGALSAATRPSTSPHAKRWRRRRVLSTLRRTRGKVAVGRRGLSRRAQRHVPARKRSTAAISNDNAMAEMKAGNDVAAGSEKASSFAVDA
ncbi:uncharacterized protein LOC144115236 [Amblyomma americanum]